MGHRARNWTIYLIRRCRPVGRLGGHSAGYNGTLDKVRIRLGSPRRRASSGINHFFGKNILWKMFMDRKGA